jgi:hypothetical protein
MADSRQALRDFVATSNSGKYKNEDELMSKFPELKSYSRQALRDFVATSNSGKYKNEDELLSKFPEFNAVKKKEATPAPKKKGVIFSPVTNLLASTSATSKPKTAQKPLVSSGGNIDDSKYYKFPGQQEATYKKSNNKWYVDTNSTGKYQPLTKGDVNARVKNLEQNAVFDEDITYSKNKSIGKILGATEGDQNNKALLRGEVFTGFPGKEQNKYRIIDDKWQYSVPKGSGYSNWADVTNDNSIKALSTQFNKLGKLDVSKNIDYISDFKAKNLLGDNATEQQLADKKEYFNNIEKQKILRASGFDVPLNGNLKDPQTVAAFKLFDAKMESKSASNNKNTQLNDKIDSVINANLITNDEEAVVSKLRKEFGADGFIFDETGIGDAITVSYSIDGVQETEPITIDLQTFRGGAPEMLKLRSYMKTKHVGDYERKLIGADTDGEAAVGTDDKVKHYSDLVSLMAKNPAKYGTELVQSGEIDNITEQGYRDIKEKYTVLGEDSKKLEEKINQYNLNPTKELELSINNDANRLKQREYQLKREVGVLKGIESNYSKAVGAYASKKEKDGSFIGGLTASFGKGIASIPKTLLNVATDVMPLTLKNNGLSDQQYEQYKQDGLTDSDIANKTSSMLKRTVVEDVEKGIINIASLGGTTKEYLGSEDRGIVSQAVNALAESIGANISGGGNPMLQKLAFFSQSYNNMESQMSGTEFDDMNALEKKGISVLYGIGIGQLEKLGFDVSTGIGTNPLIQKFINYTVGNTLKSLPKNASIHLIEEAISKNIKASIASNSIKVLAGGVAEATPEFVQSIGEVGLKNVVNAMHGKEYFQDVPDLTTADGIKEALSLASYDALVGGIGGSIMGSYSTYKSNRNTATADKDFELMNASLTDPVLLKAVKKNTVERLRSGAINKEQAQAEYADIDKSVGILKTIPANLSNREKRASYELLLEKNKLEKEIEGKDVNLVAKQKARVAEINNQLTKISEDATKESNVQEVTAEGSTSEYQGTSEGQQEVGISEGIQRETTQPSTDRGDSVVASEVQQEEVTRKIINRPSTLSEFGGQKFDTPLQGDTYIEGQQVIFEDRATGRVYELGNVDEVIDSPIAGLNTQAETVTVTNEGKISVDGTVWNTQPDLPTMGIEYNPVGEVQRVSLKDDNGNTTMFEGQKAVDIAYQIELQKIQSPEQQKLINDLLEQDEEFKTATADIKFTEAPVTIQEEAAPNIEQTVEQDQVATLRAEEQAEIKAKLPNAEYKADGKIDVDKLSVSDQLIYGSIYMKYDKLITPLLPAKKTVEQTAEIKALEDQRQEAVNELDSLYTELEGKGLTNEEIVSNPDYQKAVAKERELFLKINKPATKEGPTVEQEVEAIGQLLSGTDQEIDQKASKISNKKISKAVSRAAKAVSKIIPGTKFVVHDTDESYRAATKEEGLKQSSNGEFNAKTNTIHINGSSANNRTVAHEVFHAILINKVKTNKNAADVTKRMVQAIASKIDGNPELKKKLENFISRYDENIQNEEKLSELVGMLAENYNSFSTSVKDIITRWIDKLANIFRLDPFNRNETYDMLKTIAKKVAKGKEISEADVEILGGDSEVGTFNIPDARKQNVVKKSPSVANDTRDFIKEFVQDIDIREFNGSKFVTNMYDYTNAGITDLGNGFTINLLGGKNYVPLMMSINNKKIGDVSNLAAFNTKAQAETFIRNVEKSGSNLFAPHSGTKSQSWQFQQHTFAELVSLVLDKNILTNRELIDTFNNTIQNNAALKNKFNTFKKRYGKDINNFDTFESNPKEIVNLLDIENNLSPDIRKALNNSIASNKKFQAAIGVKNKEEFYDRIMDPLNKGIEGGEIMSVVKFDPTTFEIVKTLPSKEDHHPSFGWTVMAKIEAVYQPTEFHMSANVTDTYTKHNLSGEEVSRKANEPSFEQKNVASSAGAIPKVAEFNIEEEVTAIEDLMETRKQITPEMIDIKKEAESNGTFMKAPNGKASNLNESQWTQVRTEAFKKWFGDWESAAKEYFEGDILNIDESLSKYGSSYIIDRNTLEPLVMYHGTPSKNIIEFDNKQKTRKSSGLREVANFFSSNKELAEVYRKAEVNEDVQKDTENKIKKLIEIQNKVRNNREYYSIEAEIKELRKVGKIYEVFLNVKKPIEGQGQGLDDRAWRSLKLDIGYKTAVQKSDILDALSGNNPMYNNEKYDGAVVYNMADVSQTSALFTTDEEQLDKLRTRLKPLTGTVVAIWGKSQIKLADGTNTTFDPDSPDIRKQKPKTINDIVKLTKDQGFSDAAIRQYLKEQGYSEKNINDAMEPDTGEILVSKIREASQKELMARQKKLTIRDRIRAIRNKFIDRQSDIKRLIKGIGSKESIRAYNLLVNKAGASGFANYRFKNAEADIYKGLSKNDLDTLDDIIYARRMVAINESRAKQGAEPYTGMDGYSEVKALKDLDAIKNKIGEKKFNELSERATKYFGVFSENLKKLYESGRINEETYINLRDIEYSPIRTIKYIIGDNLDPATVDREASKLGVSKKDIMALTDSNDNAIISDSKWLLMLNVMSVEGRAFENKMLNEFSDAIDGATQEQRDAMSEFIIDNPIVKQTSTGSIQYKYNQNNVPIGYSIVSFFKNGVKKDLVVKDEYATQLLDIKSSNKALSLIGTLTGAKILRFFATGGNPLFIIGNTAVDFQNILFFSDVYSKFKLVGGAQLSYDFVRKFLKGVATKNRKNVIYNEYVEHGGAMDFLSNDGLRSLKSLSPKNKILNLSQKVLVGYGNIMSYLGEKSELAFRLAVYDKVKGDEISKFKKENGRGPDAKELDDIMYEATRNARETMDFNQGGTWVKTADNVMPYLNASMQGFRRPLEYAKNNPLGFTSSLVQAAVMAGSVAALSLAALMRSVGDDEEEKKKVLDVLESLSDYEKATYHIIFTGKKDKDGEYEYYRIKKLPVLSVISTATEQFTYKYLLSEAGIKYDVDQEVINKSISASTPFSPSDIASRNPLISGLLTYSFNWDSFTGEKIFREPRDKKIAASAEGMYDDKVEEIYKKIAPSLGLSPLRTKAAIEKIVTSENTNPMISIFYASVNGFFNKDGYGAEFSEAFNNVFDASARKLKRTTNKDNIRYKQEDKIENQEMIIETDIYNKEQKVYNTIKNVYKDGKELSNGQLIDLIKTNFEKKDQEKYAKKYYAYIKNMNIDRSILDILYEETPEVQALRLYNRYGSELDSEEKKILSKVMGQAKMKLSKQALYIYDKKYSKRK